MNLSAWAKRRSDAIENIKIAASIIIREKELPLTLLEELGRNHRDPAVRELFALEATAHLLEMVADGIKPKRRIKE